MQAHLPKQYLPLLGRPVILHTLERLCGYPRLRGVVVGIAPDDDQWRTLFVAHLKKLLGTFNGGSSRAQTVLNGLVALATHAARDDDWVMVHDAVRPCVRHADFDKLLAAAATSPDGALLGIPVADTTKRADPEGRVEETISRSGLWRALTPQMFRIKTLRSALEAMLAKKADVTDDSLAVERLGARPQLVEGFPDNIKITRPADLVLAEMFLKQQEGSAI
jgi:2-C-methyl-D-erythritol 4-phosphate cytidylyltransferase